VADRSQRERVPGAHLVSPFPAAPAPLQLSVASVARRVPGRSVEELGPEELDFADPRFPLVAWTHAEKAG
jgi:hypothetical protein